MSTMRLCDHVYQINNLFFPYAFVPLSSFLEKTEFFSFLRSAPERVLLLLLGLFPSPD